MPVARAKDRDPFDRWILFGCVLLILGSIVFYDDTFSFSFSFFDDYKIIGGHPQLYADGSVIDRINQILFLDYPREEPLIMRDLSWLADSIAFGFNRPFGYHFGNVVYHAITLLLAFLIFRRLTDPATALLTTALISVLAIHVEPVAWIMGRKDILSTLFSLFAVYLFLRFRESVKTPKKVWAYTGSLLFACAAYLSKPNTVVLPGVLLICALAARKDFVKFGFRTPELKALLAKLAIQLLPFFALGLGVFIWYQSVLEDFGLWGKALQYSFQDYWRLLFILNPLVLLEYLKILVYPEHLSAYYTLPTLYSDFTITQVVLAISVTAAAAGSVVVLWRVNRAACLFLIGFFILMLPYANWVHLGFWYANRYMYFSSMFLVAALSHLTVSQFRSRHRTLSQIAVLIPVTLVFALNVYYRNDYLPVWRDGVTLWSYEATLPDASIHAFNNLTAAYIARSESALPEDREQWLRKALAANDRALELDLPAWQSRWLAVSNYHRGLVLSYMDAPLRLQLDAFLNAVKISPDYADALWSVGVSLYQMARKDEDPDTRLDLARRALTYLQRHFEVRERNRHTETERSRFMSRMQSDFPGLNLSETESRIKP